MDSDTAIYNSNCFVNPIIEGGSDFVYIRRYPSEYSVPIANGICYAFSKKCMDYIKGADFKDLKESNIIFFCTFDPFRKGLPRYTFCNTCEELPDLKLADKCRKIAYNVNAFKKVGDEKVRKLLEFISTGKSETSLTNKISNELRRVQGNEEWRAEYMTWEMLKQDTYDSGFSAGEEHGIAIGEKLGEERGITIGRNEGIAIGEERGRNEGISLGITQGAYQKAVETAKSMKQENMSVSLIARFTGLSPEEIEKLSDSLN